MTCEASASKHASVFFPFFAFSCLSLLLFCAFRVLWSRGERPYVLLFRIPSPMEVRALLSTADRLGSLFLGIYT
jgi:hypothetical protein